MWGAVVFSLRALLWVVPSSFQHCEARGPVASALKNAVPPGVGDPASAETSPSDSTCLWPGLLSGLFLSCKYLSCNTLNIFKSFINFTNV